MKFNKFLLAAVAFLPLVSCGKYSDKDKGTTGTTVIACDETFRNIIEDEISVYELRYPKANVLAEYLNENACVDSLMQLKAKTIVISRELTENETKVLVSKKKKPLTSKIAVDAIAIIVNHDNPVNTLSVEDVKKILTGEYTNWNDWQPSTLGEIKVIFDHQGSSTVNYMRKNVMDGQSFGPNTFAQGSCPDVIEAVSKMPNAIGIIGVSWLSSDLAGDQAGTRHKEAGDSDTQAANGLKETVDGNNTNVDFELYSRPDQYNTNVKVLAIRDNNKLQAYKPFQIDIYNGDYPFYRSIYMITTSQGGMPSHAFYSFVTSIEGQKIMLTTGILPAIVPLKRVEL